MYRQSNVIPKWIESKLFEEIFRQTQPKYQSTKNFKVYHALAPGENYATIMLKVEAEVMLKDGSTDDLSYMLKISHSGEHLPEDFKSFNVFEVENGMYKEIVPEFERMYAKVGRKVRFGAKSYTLATQVEHVLLEDLKRYGFKNVKRQDCLDLEHLKNALEKLAQWHAASANLIENLILLNYSQPLPTLRQVQQMLIKYGLWAMVPIAVTLPIVLCEPSEKASLDSLVGRTDNSQEFKNLLYSNELFLKHLKLILPWLLYRGALEY
uniref:CHK kinase-like domain-containing protein n=1 Tax=Glossina morsitans morsitans TaxID=37546 RepID=A0A1B0G5F6_GLOMM